jgi:hypothetical protein
MDGCEEKGLVNGEQWIVDGRKVVTIGRTSPTLATIH